MPAMSASAFGDLTVIVDPAAGEGRVGLAVPELERALEKNDLPSAIRLSTSDADATAIAREALVDGGRFLVAVGDDGTVQAVLNGMFEDGRPIVEGAVLGIVPAGANCDLVKSFGLPGDVDGAVEHLTGANTYAFDVVKMTCTGPDGERVTRYGHNLAEAGFGGAVLRRMDSLPRWTGRARRFIGFWMAFARMRLPNVKVEADRKVFEGRAYNVVVANAQFTSGGLRLSPRSFPGDGWLDALVFQGPRSEALTMLPRLYRHGDHIPDPHIQELRAKIRIAVDADRPLPIVADGAMLGATPATFQIVPQSILLKL
jgi:diacylglycerol kinase (ATP)